MVPRFELTQVLFPSVTRNIFLYPHQVSKTMNCRIENNFNTIVSNVKCPISLVNSCLEPKATYEDDLAPLFDESSVERRIDKMLTCDSLGIGDVPSDLSNYDKEKTLSSKPE